MKRSRAALYLRVSSEMQTLENQRPELVRLAKARGLRVVKTYEEKVSAVKVRPAFDQMIADAHAGAFDTLIVWALDRFGRSMLGNLQAVLDLDAKGVLVVSSRESWLEMEGPVRPLLVMIISWVAEQERARLSERTIAGMARARAQGLQIGRPRAVYSTTYARTLQAEGKSVAEIARLLKVSESSMRRAFARRGGPLRGDDAEAIAEVGANDVDVIPPKGGSRKPAPKSAKSRPRA